MATSPFVIPTSLNVSISRVQRTALIVGAVAIVLTAIGGFFDPVQFFRSYLLGYMVPFGVALGSLAVLMLQYLSGGAWGMLIRRPLEAATRTLPLMAVMLGPLLFGMRFLFEWMNQDAVNRDAVLTHKQLYLNSGFFIARQLIYFAIWIFFALKLNSLSRKEEEGGPLEVSRLLMGFSGPGLLIYVLTLTFFSIDWIMSLDARWFSTIFGFITLAGQGLAAFSTMIITVGLLMRSNPMRQVVTKKHLHDLGKFLFMFTMLWTYLSFSQFLIIWAGNLPEEITFFIARMNGGWEWIALGVLLFQFFLPFLILLSQDVKRDPRKIMKVAIFVLIIRLLDFYWTIEPNFHRSQFFFHWMDLAAPIGLSGLWVAAYLGELKKRPLMAINAPDLDKALAHGRSH